MKNYKLLIALISVVLFSSSCMEDYNERYLMNDYFVEFEEATIKSKAVEKDYVISAETIKSEGKDILVQVNLVGPQFQEDQIINYQIVEDETTAVEGRDYNIESIGKLLLKASSSIATMKISPTSTGIGETLLVLKLEGNNMIKPSENYKKIAIRCVYP